MAVVIFFWVTGDTDRLVEGVEQTVARRTRAGWRMSAHVPRPTWL
jgi:hypothetical protein